MHHGYNIITLTGWRLCIQTLSCFGGLKWYERSEANYGESNGKKLSNVANLVTAFRIRSLICQLDICLHVEEVAQTCGFKSQLWSPFINQTSSEDRRIYL